MFKAHWNLFYLGKFNFYNSTHEITLQNRCWAESSSHIGLSASVYTTPQVRPHWTRRRWRAVDESLVGGLCLFHSFIPNKIVDGMKLCTEDDEAALSDFTSPPPDRCSSPPPQLIRLRLHRHHDGASPQIESSN
jgi:hypothetical protein